MVTPPRPSTPRKRARAVVRAALSALSTLDRDPGGAFVQAVKILKSRQGKILVSGVGKSAAVASKAAATLTSLGHPAFLLDPLSALHGDSGMVGKGDVLIAISFSGNSAELVKTVKHVKQISKSKIIALTHGSSSTLAALATVVLDVPVKKEGSPHELAPMASTTTTLVITDMLAAALTEPEHFTRSSFATFHPGGSLGLSLASVKSAMHPLKKTPHVLEDASFLEALATMTKSDLGVTAVVSKQGYLRGILTDGDVRRIVFTHADAKKLSLKKLMTPRPKTIAATATLKDALERMEHYRITALFVVGKGAKLMGFLHMHDIVERSL